MVGLEVAAADMDHARIQDVFRRVACAAECATPLVVANASEMRAWTDGTTVYVTDALIRGMTEREVAAVLGHELGHVVERHIETSNTERDHLRESLRSSFPDDWLASVVATAVVEVALYRASGSRSRALEHRADEYGERYARAAGYTPGGMADALDRFPDARESFTHPSTPDRKSVLSGGNRKIRIRIKRTTR
jgi:predicted Zn-dependent protease